MIKLLFILTLPILLNPEIIVNHKIRKTMVAIAKIESNYSKTPYKLLGKPGKNGDRAYGKYQIMCSNIPKWTKQATGKSYTCQQFLHNPLLQETTATYFISYLIDKYGPAGAARAWFAGEGGMNKLYRKDGYGTTVKVYNDKFMKYYNEI